MFFFFVFLFFVFLSGSNLFYFKALFFGEPHYNYTIDTTMSTTCVTEKKIVEPSSDDDSTSDSEVVEGDGGSESETEEEKEKVNLTPGGLSNFA